MEESFQAKPNDILCNDCAIYDICLQLEKSGGVKHNGAKACKYFILKLELKDKKEN